MRKKRRIMRRKRKSRRGSRDGTQSNIITTLISCNPPLDATQIAVIDEVTCGDEIEGGEGPFRDETVNGTNHAVTWP